MHDINPRAVLVEHEATDPVGYCPNPVEHKMAAALTAVLEVERIPFPEFQNVHAINTRDGHNMALDKVRRVITTSLNGDAHD